MSGLFAAWQPTYADHGIPTFPVRFDGADKRPRTTGYLKIGLPGSNQLALKFPDADAFGFMLGRRSRITVLDIDTTCERARDAAFDRHGDPAIVVRSASGKWHGWYRHNGERRRIRPWGPTPPIDVLGYGFAVAPPSKGPQGRYTFVKGSLEDLHRLAPLRGVDLPKVCTVRAGDALVREGERNKSLVYHCLRQARHCDDLETLIDVARTYAENHLDILGTTHPVTEAEIINVACWAWALEAKGLNLVARGGATVVRHNVVDTIAASDPDAFALYTILWRHHSDRREFVMANAMAESLGWDLRRFKSARTRLCTYDLIRCVHRGGTRPGDPPRYRWVSE